MKLIKNERAVIVKDYLVISDLHLGIEFEMKEKGYRIPDLSKEFIRRIKKIKDDIKGIIILGDVKHNIKHAEDEEFFEIRRFLRELKKMFEKIIIIKGNHDGKLERVTKGLDIPVLSEYSIDNYGFIHGHKYPSERIMEKKYLIMGHMHPAVKIKDKNGKLNYFPCYIIGKLNKSKVKKRYKKINVEKILVIPPFNKMLGGYSLKLGPIARNMKIEERILLDLTII